MRHPSVYASFCLSGGMQCLTSAAAYFDKESSGASHPTTEATPITNPDPFRINATSPLIRHNVLRISQVFLPERIAEIQGSSMIKPLLICIAVTSRPHYSDFEFIFRKLR